jgi:hypothetical protein
MNSDYSIVNVDVFNVGRPLPNQTNFDLFKFNGDKDLLVIAINRSIKNAIKNDMPKPYKKATARAL